MLFVDQFGATRVWLVAMWCVFVMGSSIAIRDEGIRHIVFQFSTASLCAAFVAIDLPDNMAVQAAFYLLLLIMVSAVFYVIKIRVK
jgi:hypothetical protein